MSIDERRVEPEILDGLSPDDPAAIRSRQDLRRINWITAQASLMQSGFAARDSSAPPRSLVDLGSGDGTFMLAVARGLARRWSGVEVTLVDQQGRPSAATIGGFEQLGWKVRPVVAEVTEFLCRGERFDAAVANLFLHHFEGAALAQILRMIASSTEFFVACEPKRARLPLLAGRLVWFIGSGPVTRHDAVASVRAGFSRKELSALWPAIGWRIDERRAGLFTHRFVASRLAPR